MTTVQISQTYDEVARSTRNALRGFSVESIADVALQSLESFRGRGLDELRSAPWLTALIIKLVLEDKQTHIRSGGTCPIEVFDRLRQTLWEVSPLSSVGGNQDVHLGLRVMLHTQLQFQNPESWSFLRWPALILDLPKDHPTLHQFERVLGMSPDAFIGICWAAYAAVVGGQQMIERAYFESLKPLYGDAVDSFLAMFAKDLGELRKILRADFDKRLAALRTKGQGAPVRDAIEVAEFPWLHRYPLLLHHTGKIAVWHPLIFARGMEQAVHQAMSNLGQKYTDHFSKVFESYVVTLLQGTGQHYVDEATFKSTHSRSSAAVEAIVRCEGGNILLESKMSLFPEEVVSSDSPRVVFRKLRRIREAIVQGWKVSKILADDAAVQGKNYLLVVTSRQLNVCSGVHLRRLLGDNVFSDILPEDGFGKPESSQLAWLPPENMFFLSIDEFEHLSGCLRSSEVDLWSLLNEAADAQATPASSTFHFDQLLGKYTSRWQIPDIQRQARDRVETQFKRYFESQG